MKQFLEKYGSRIKGILSGWDRLALRGTIRQLANVMTLGCYLNFKGVLLKDFKPWAETMTKKVRTHCEQVADNLNIERRYLRSSSIDKEQLAREIAQERNIETGPICMLSVVEPCLAPTVVGDRANKLLKLLYRNRRCIWIYFYFNDAQLGFGHIRLQSWLPFTIKGNLNGRHWLERSLIEQGIDYIKAKNCFRWIDDPKTAQALMDEQLKSNWVELFNGLSSQYFSIVNDLVPEPYLKHYWSVDESEWASDIMFPSTAELDRLFPMFARHGLVTTDSANVMRFLGQIPAEAVLPSRVTGDIRGDRKRRYEGICVKHRHGGNSIKIYNKAGNILRVETTINQTRSFKSFRHPDDDQQRPANWLPMRKGVSDLHRRAEISQKANERYLNNLSTAASEATVYETISRVCQRHKKKGRNVRALNPWQELDHEMLKFLSQGKWSLNGFRNRDLAAWLNPDMGELSQLDRRRLTSRVSRLLFLLRSHGLIKKIPRTYRYELTEKGREISALITTASTVQNKELMGLAA